MSRIEGERPVRLLRGPAATEWLGAEGNRAAWRQLHAACPWGTVFQGPAFADAWYESYATVQEPVVVVGQTAHTELAGLLLLARDRLSGTLAHVGSHQAEYQAWLARPESAERFPVEALAAIRQARLASWLSFRYLAPGTPLPAAAQWRHQGIYALVRPARRGQVGLGPASAVHQSLRKKSNRSRLKRLERLGSLSLRQLQSREELADVLPTIAAYCDLRQGAVNAVTPFRSDPLKGLFHLRMMEEPSLLHATILMAGDQVVACHLGQVNRDTVLLGVTAHSPYHADDSPGKLMLLLLLEHLGREGFTRFDLTPEGAYKERFAEDYDEVVVLDCHFRALPAWRERLRRSARALLRRAIRHADLEHAWVSRQVQAAARVLREAPNRLMGRFRPAPGAPLRFRLPGGSVVPPPPAGEYRANAINDLLAYHPLEESSPGLHEFLADASQRLARGEVVHTQVAGGVLSHWGWLLPAGEGAAGVLLQLGCGRKGPVGDVHAEAFLRHRIHDAARFAGSKPIFIQVARDDSASLQTLAGIGFLPCPEARGTDLPFPRRT